MFPPALAVIRDMNAKLPHVAHTELVGLHHQDQIVEALFALNGRTVASDQLTIGIEW